MMTVKYNIGFTIDAETLFGMIVKFVPLENLTVQEVIERAAPKLMHAPKLAAPKQKRQKMKRQGAKPPNLDRGLNAILLGALADGEPHRPVELKAAIEASGAYAADSLSSRLASLIKNGHVAHVGQGLYQLAKKNP